jgi:hypothetical protein
LCLNATGLGNGGFLKKAKGHHAGRCTQQYKHVVRKFPDWLEQLDLSLDDKRKLSRGMALKDSVLIGTAFYNTVLKYGPTGNDEVKMLEAEELEKLETDEEARRQLEYESYPVQEPVDLE